MSTEPDTEVDVDTTEALLAEGHGPGCACLGCYNVRCGTVARPEWWGPTPLIVRGDARTLPITDASVDLIVTSPPYFGLRSYSDGGKHYREQIGSEPSPLEFLDALVECTREMIRVLKPTGSIWVNLGDKYVADNRGGGRDTKRGRAKYGPAGPAGPAGFVGRDLARQKSLMLLPHRYAIRCEDELGLIVRQDQVWSKVNGMPESVTDRTGRAHEYLFHMVKQPSYYSAMDDIRSPNAPDTHRVSKHGSAPFRARNASLPRQSRAEYAGPNPLGATPGSVWEIASQPLNVPDRVAHTRCCDGAPRPGCVDGLDHYAAFPMALVHPIILGWSPREVCSACGEGRRPVADKARVPDRVGRVQGRSIDKLLGGHGPDGRAGSRFAVRSTVTGYACRCVDSSAPSSPGVVLDPFGGTACAPLVAAMNGRTGISVDYSWDYCDVLARWRVRDPKERARAAGLDPEAVARIPTVDVMQRSLMDLFDEEPAGGMRRER